MNDEQNKNNAQSDIKFFAELVSPILAKRTDIAAAYLLGSAATGKLRNDSDIDIALLPMDEKVIPLQSCLELAVELEEKLKRPADIGIITTKNLIYASEAILNGHRITTLQQNYTEMTETRLLGCYFTFRQDRKEVEESYRVA